MANVTTFCGFYKKTQQKLKSFNADTFVQVEKYINIWDIQKFNF